MLERLAKNDKKYRELALKITKNKSDADDLVQDMYLKLMNTQRETITNRFIFVVMNHMYLDKKRKKKREISLQDIQGYKDVFTSEDCNENELLTLFKQELASIDYIRRELLIEGTYKSTRELASKYDINHVKVWRKQDSAKEELKNKFNKTYKKYK